MSLIGYLLSLSPLVLFAVSFLLRSPTARKVARWTALPWILALMPAIWMAYDCRGEELGAYRCTLTPDMLVEPLRTVPLFAAIAWILVGPVLLITIAVIEWLGRR